MAKRIAAEKDRAGLRNAAVCPNVTGRTKNRVVVAQSKRARAGSFAIVDKLFFLRMESMPHVFLSEWRFSTL